MDKPLVVVSRYDVNIFAKFEFGPAVHIGFADLVLLMFGIEIKRESNFFFEFWNAVLETTNILLKFIQKCFLKEKNIEWV